MENIVVMLQYNVTLTAMLLFEITLGSVYKYSEVNMSNVISLISYLINNKKKTHEKWSMSHHPKDSTGLCWCVKCCF